MKRIICLILFATAFGFSQEKPAPAPKEASFEEKVSVYWKTVAIAESMRAQYAEAVNSANQLKAQAVEQGKSVQAALADLSKSCEAKGKILAGLDAAPFQAECQAKPKPEAGK